MTAKMFRPVLALAAMLLLGACTKQESVSFIPSSPLTPAEIEQARAGLRNSPESADLDADAVIAAGDSMFTYRVEDIQRALQGIDGADELVSFCSSVVMDGATSLVLLAPATSETVVVKSASCSPVQGGLSCGSISSVQMAWYKRPDIFFELRGSVDTREANSVLARFERGGIQQLPSDLQHFDYSAVTAIGKTDSGYRLELGDRFCPACNTLLDVVITSTDELMLVGAPQQLCH
jgi:hypothetical protein